MSAMSLLIGFGWEQCFDDSVSALASNAPSGVILNPHTTRLALTFFCAGLLVPAWKWYMLPYIVAKGWRYKHPLRVQDVLDVARELIKVDEEEGDDEESSRMIVDAAELSD